MTEQTTAQPQEDAATAIYNYAAGLMKNGVADDKIKSDLIERGLSSEAAGTVVNNLIVIRKEQRKKTGQKNMLYGALWCIGGIAVTVGTYAMAEGGGTYMVAYGAVIFGAIQFFQGIYQSASS